MILLMMIWAICPVDSLALLGQWIQGKLVEVRLLCGSVYHIHGNKDLMTMRAPILCSIKVSHALDISGKSFSLTQHALCFIIESL